MNHVAISGNLTRDPELVTTSNGNELCRFSVAVEQSFKDSSGEWQTKAHFIDCTMFGGRARLLANKARKGDLVTVDGRLDFSQWETDDGQKRSKLAVVANEAVGEFQFRKSDGSDTPARSEGDSTEAPAAAPSADDDIPF